MRKSTSSNKTKQASQTRKANGTAIISKAKRMSFPWKTVAGTSAALGVVGIAWNMLRDRNSHGMNAERAIQTDFTPEGAGYKEDFSERL